MGLFELTDKVAVITGSTRGIGRAIAQRMAEAGAKVVVSSRKAERCDEVAAAIRACGGEAIAVPCNVSRPDQLRALVDRALEHYGRIDVLVGNAAANPHFGAAATIEESMFDKIIDANVKANLWLANMVIPQMAARRDGVVILVSSIAGFKGTAEIGAYGISKAAEMALARNLAVEWGPSNVRVNCIAPGLVRTDFARALWEDPAKLARAVAAYPLRRLGEPDDVAGVAVFLASPAAAFITGQTIVVDGGVTIAGSV